MTANGKTAEDAMTQTTTEPKTFNYGRRRCPECGEAFTARNPAQGFCCTDHQKRFHMIEAQRGKIATPLLQVWRKGKNGRSEDTAYALSQLSALADKWNAQDRAAGRRADIIVSRKRREKWSAADVG
jgi:hypothetical protein